MKLQSKVIGGCLGLVVMLASPRVQASAWDGAAASAANNASNSAVQSAVRSARDDAARRAMARGQWNELRHTHHHGRSPLSGYGWEGPIRR
jgi:hypothetical protein